MKKLALLLCVLTISLVGMTGCGKISYDSQEFLTSGVDSYSYYYCIDTGSTNSTLNREFSRFHGKDTIWKLDAAQAAQVSIDISATVTDGRFKILLIAPDKSITTLLEGEGTAQVEAELKEGTSRMILVGEESEGSCKITVGDAPNVTIHPTFRD